MPAAMVDVLYTKEFLVKCKEQQIPFSFIYVYFMLCKYTFFAPSK